MDDSFDPIIEGLQDDFCTGKYSDMRLVAGDGTIYHVHKVVLCHQSKFFENAMKEGRFREGYENMIHLEDKDSQTVYTMLRYLYYHNFRFPSSCKTATDYIVFAINLYALGDEYHIDPLCRYAFERLKEQTTNIPAESLERILSNFPRIAHAAYDQLPYTGKRIKLLVVSLAKDNIFKLLAHEGILSLIQELPEFARDLLALQGADQFKIRGQRMIKNTFVEEETGANDLPLRLH
ncbi:Btb poz domain protein [Lasiodiplodia theobromae]|uniref:Btb poz domain protein n=1 Tax=Lasiodiplodia theobromae TaxID=45133 RepID=UPI0015C30C6C|nr:Btb poz domain protein [Lasiodiplodia theobromae]KAF4541461.1 Btb poz domain protein [Lasiodiplodia theobromae]